MSIGREEIAIVWKTFDEIIISAIKVNNELLSPIYNIDEDNLLYMKNYLRKCVNRKTECQGSIKPYIFRDKDYKILFDDKKLIEFDTAHDQKVAGNNLKNYQKKVIEESIKKQKEEDKYDSRDYFQDTILNYKFDCRHSMLGSTEDLTYFVEFFHHIIGEITKNAYNYYFKIQQKRMEIETTKTLQALPIESINANEAIPLDIDDAVVELMNIDALINNYTIKIRTFEDSQHCNFVCQNPAALTIDEFKNLKKTIEDAFSYNAKKSDETTKAMKRITSSISKWGGMGLLMSCNMLNRINGVLKPSYDPQNQIFKMHVQIPKATLAFIPGIMKQ